MILTNDIIWFITKIYPMGVCEMDKVKSNSYSNKNEIKEWRYYEERNLYH